MTENSLLGRGYSSDSEQIVTNKCYDAIVSSTTGMQSHYNIDTQMSFHELERFLKIDISAKGGMGMFSASASADYIRSMEEKEYSKSLNYFMYLSDTVNVQVSGLTDFGKNEYNTNNKFFGLRCGDYFIESYEQGGLLTMGINISFMSKQDKEIFEAKAGADLGTFFSASASIQKIASELGMQGSVSMQVFQLGGEPQKIPNAMQKDEKGNYHFLNCSLLNMDACLKTAGDLVDYAKEFSSQISFEGDQKGLVALGQGFEKHAPVNEIKLEKPKSLVDDSVNTNREKLGHLLEENKYYQDKLHQLKGYPVKLSQKVTDQIEKLEKQVQSNLDIISNPSSTNKAAIACYDNPEECDGVAKKIFAKVSHITPDDLQFLDKIKYSVGTFCGTLYSDGEDKLEIHPILGLICPEPSQGPKFHYQYVSGLSADINDTVYDFSMDVKQSLGDEPLFHVTYHGESHDGMHYNGMLNRIKYADGTGSQYQIGYQKEISPYYFTIFKQVELSAEENITDADTEFVFPPYQGSEELNSTSFSINEESLII